MNKNITLGQALGGIISLFIAVLAGWVSLNSRVSQHDESIKNLRDNYQEIKASIKEVGADQKETKSTVNEIRVILERKADRK